MPARARGASRDSPKPLSRRPRSCLIAWQTRTSPPVGSIGKICPVRRRPRKTSHKSARTFFLTGVCQLAAPPLECRSNEVTLPRISLCLLLVSPWVYLVSGSFGSRHLQVTCVAASFLPGLVSWCRKPEVRLGLWVNPLLQQHCREHPFTKPNGAVCDPAP